MASCKECLSAVVFGGFIRRSFWRIYPPFFWAGARYFGSKKIHK